MYNVPIKRDVCATCKWWRSSRDVKFGGREPLYVVVDNIAPAGHPCSAWNKDMSATHTCHRYSRWEKL